MWLYDNSAFFSNVDYRTRRKWCGVILNCGLLVIATFLTVAGTYGSMCASSLSLFGPRVICSDARPCSSRSVSIANSSKTRPWTCADNSGSS